MKKIIVLFLMALSATAQVKKVKATSSPLKNLKETIKPNVFVVKQTIKSVQKSKWYAFNSLGLNMSEVAFSNWNAGGVNSISILTDARFRRRYMSSRYFWDNEIFLNYGINLREGEQMRKTDDQIVLNSTYGYRTSEHSDWYYSSKMSFNSQFSRGYHYPKRDNFVSEFLSPGYLFLGLGAEYAPQKENIIMFISPLTLKSTFVLNERLADKGAFGVKPAQFDVQGNKITSGEKINTEIGARITGDWNFKIYDNINVANRFSFYTDYTKNFGNIDVDWETTLHMKVNDYVQARLGIHLKYDDDVKFKEEILSNGAKHLYGSRIQLKQILGLGVSYKF